MVSPAKKGFYQQIYDKIGFSVSVFAIYVRSFGPIHCVEMPTYVLLNI